MKDPKPTKKELASQTRELEEQVNRLKNRVNGQAFKKTKHGYRLDQLSEDTQQLNARISGLERQLGELSKAQDELAKNWQALSRDTYALKNQPKDPSGRKRLKRRLGKLKSSVAGLGMQQQQIRNTLGELQGSVGRVGSVRDDLKLETDELRSQIRNLEENSSRFSVSQSNQEERIRELEGLLAELTLRQQNLAAEDQALAKNIQHQLDGAVAPLREQLQQLGGTATEESGRHKEVDRRLQELANRIGDLGGRFNHLGQEVTDQHQLRERLKQELDPRLQQLEARNAEIDNLETQLHDSLKRETGALWQKLEDKSRDLDNIRERLEALSGSEQSPELDRKLNVVAAEVNRLSEAEAFLEESFRGIGGLELNLTSRLDSLQRQLQENIGRSKAYETAFQRLSAEFDDISGNLQQLLQADQSHQDKIAALAQQQELLTERELNSDQRRQDVDGQLDRIEESFAAERERLSLLEENFSQVRDQNATQTLELEQGRGLQQALESRIEDLVEDFASQTDQNSNLTTRVEEHTGHLQALSDRIDEQAEQQSALIKEGESVKQILSKLDQRGRQSEKQSAGLEQEQRALRQQLEAEKSDIEEQSRTLQALASSFGALDAKVRTQQPRIENIESYGKTSRVAFIALLLMGLLGGLALYLSNMGGIAESEQQITQKLISPDSQEDLAEKLKALEAGLAGNSGRISELEAAQPDPGLSRIIGIEQKLKKTADQLDAAGIDQLKIQQNSIAKIERNLSDTSKAFGERLNELETDSAQTREMFSQLQRKVQALVLAGEAPDQAVASRDRTDSAASRQPAADARRYTIQLAGSRNKSALNAFASSQPLEREVAYYRTVHEGREWYVLLYGRFSSFGDASKALESLPSSLIHYRPWLRRIPSEAAFLVR